MLRRPRTICDVGSCDGTERVQVPQAAPGCADNRLEANPDNNAAICADPRSAEIEVRHEAASEGDGEAIFYLLDVLSDKPWESWVRGSSFGFREVTRGQDWSEQVNVVLARDIGRVTLLLAKALRSPHRRRGRSAEQRRQREPVPPRRGFLARPSCTAAGGR